MTLCNFCGSDAELPFSVDLLDNTLAFGWTEISVTPQTAEIAYVLAKAYPNAVTNYDLANAIYGAGGETENEFKVISKQVGGLRKKMAGTGWTVYTNYLGEMQIAAAASHGEGRCPHCGAAWSPPAVAFDKVRGYIYFDGKPVKAQRPVINILEELIRAQPRAVPGSQLRHIAGVRKMETGQQSVKVFMTTLRRTLEGTDWRVPVCPVGPGRLARYTVERIT